MCRKFPYLYLFAFMLILINGCTKKQPEITIYGSNQCHHCTDLKAALDSAGMVYTFNDIDTSDQFAREMFEKVKESNQTNVRISLPVVQINEQEVLIGANFNSLQKALEE